MKDAPGARGLAETGGGHASFEVEERACRDRERRLEFVLGMIP
jgi:hypothetical protein